MSLKELYIKHFSDLLLKYNVETPADLDQKDKSKFFTELDKTWTSKEESKKSSKKQGVNEAINLLRKLK